jgi:hypothetical protein
MTLLDRLPSVTDEVIATIPELPRDADPDAQAPAPLSIPSGSWPDADYRGWSGL